jgi:hypothetical protein
MSRTALASTGYPPQYYEEVARSRAFAIRAVGVTGVCAVIAGISALRSEGPLLFASITAAVFFFTLAASIGGIVDSARHVRLMPYYRRRVGETDTFLAGQALARNFRDLEWLAGEARVPPFSRFGFADDLAGQTVVWYPAVELLVTVRGLAEVVRTEPEAVRDAEAVLHDLARWEAAFVRAADQDIELALLIQFGNSTSGMEWDRRIGDPF